MTLATAALLLLCRLLACLGMCTEAFEVRDRRAIHVRQVGNAFQHVIGTALVAPFRLHVCDNPVQVLLAHLARLACHKCRAQTRKLERCAEANVVIAAGDHRLVEIEIVGGRPRRREATTTGKE